MNELYLGSHLPMAGPLFYEGTCQNALQEGANAFMFYTGAPQNSLRLPLSELRIPEGRALLAQAGLDESKIVVHAPYILNLANRSNEDNWQAGQRLLLNEMNRSAAFGAPNLVLHPGNAIGVSTEEAIQNLASALNALLPSAPTNVTICLETMAGKGHEIGRSFEELAAILAHVDHPERYGVCLDTCHLSDAGYDVRDPASLLAEFDRTIGIAKIRVVHLNDSLNPRGSHKDRHANLGRGSLGFPTLLAWAKSEALAGVPKILETPFIDEKDPHAAEIRMLRQGRYEEEWWLRLKAD